MDAISESRLSLVMPQLADRIRELSNRLSDENILIRVTQGLRTTTEQNLLYAQGRTSPGHIVTHAANCESWHVLGCAVDVAPMDENIPDWNENHPCWKRLVELGENLGLTSGMSWHDEPHFELTGKYPPKPPIELQTAFVKDGLSTVWSMINTK